MTIQEIGSRKQEAGLHLVRRAVREDDGLQVVREGSTGRVVVIHSSKQERLPGTPVIHPSKQERLPGTPAMVPRIWAVAEAEGCAASDAIHDDETVINAALPSQECSPGTLDGPPAVMDGPLMVEDGSPSPEAEVAFYRKYTEAMLRRYLRLSMAAGRVPSLLGRELFRGNVTSYRVQNFEDVVIFCHDVEKCLSRLDGRERDLIKRIALQAYSQAEAAGMLGISLRCCLKQYARTLDRLTRMLLKAGMLEPLKSCQ